MVQVDDLIEPGAKQILFTRLSLLPWPHLAPRKSFLSERITNQIRKESPSAKQFPGCHSGADNRNQSGLNIRPKERTRMSKNRAKQRPQGQRRRKQATGDNRCPGTTWSQRV
jgi:hypothetical protein